MRTRAVSLLTLVAVGVAIAVLPASATAQVSVSIDPEATLTRDGAIRLSVLASCPAGSTVLEAFVTVSQDDGAVFGRGGIPLRCTGRTRKHRVVVRPVEGSFHTGTAFASAFVLTCADPACNTTEQGQDAREVRVR